MDIYEDYKIDDLEKEFQNIIDNDPDQININFEHLEKINSLLIGTLVKFYNIAKIKKIKLVLYNMNIMIFDIFEKCGLKKCFNINLK
jgi:anti-anti-sigma factor